MTCSVIRVSEDLKRPAGHAIISISVAELTELPSSIEFSIRRRGHNENCLGENSWQGADYWFPPEEAWFADNNQLLQFVFRKDSIYELQHMPYELFLRGKGMEESVAIPLHWPDTLESEGETEGERRPIGEGVHIQDSSPSTSDNSGETTPKSPILSEPFPEPEPDPEPEKVTVSPTKKTPTPPPTKEFGKKQGESDFLKLLLFLGLLAALIIIAILAGYYLVKDSPVEPDPEQQTVQEQPVNEENHTSSEPQQEPTPSVSTPTEPVISPTPEAEPEPDRQPEELSPSPVINHEESEPLPEQASNPTLPVTEEETAPSRSPSLDSNLESDLKKELEQEENSTIESNLEYLLNQEN